MKKKHIRAPIAIIVAAILWSLDGTFLRPKLYALPVELVVFIEHILGLLVFLPLLISGRKQVKKMPITGRGAVLRVSLFGGVLGTIAITKAFFLAIDGETTFATVIILQKLQPIFALSLAALLLKEKLPKGFYPLAVVAVIASYLLAFGTSQGVGDIHRTSSAGLFALFAAFAFGSSTVFGKKLVGQIDSKRATGLRFLTTSVLIGIYLLMTGGFSEITSIETLQRQTFGMIVISSGALALFLYYYGLKKTPASLATILELARPLSAVLLDYLLNGNSLSSIQRGAAVVLIGVMMRLSYLQNSKKK